MVRPGGTWATSYFIAGNRNKYLTIYTALVDTLPQLAQDMQNISLIYLRNRFAKYRIRRTEATGLMTYYIYFAKDEGDGIWRIQQF